MERKTNVQVTNKGNTVSIKPGYDLIEVWLNDVGMPAVLGEQYDVDCKTRYNVLLEYQEGRIGVEGISVMRLSYFSKRVTDKKDWDFQITFGTDGFITIIRKNPEMRSGIEFLSSPAAYDKDTPKNKRVDWAPYNVLGRGWAEIPFGKKSQPVANVS